MLHHDAIAAGGKLHGLPTKESSVMGTPHIARCGEAAIMLHRNDTAQLKSSNLREYDHLHHHTNPGTSLGRYTSTVACSEDHLYSPTPASPNGPATYQPIILLLEKVHQWGYSFASMAFVGLSLVGKRPDKPYKHRRELFNAITMGVTAGELIEMDQDGTWILLPVGSAHRSPYEKRRVERPEEGEAGEWDRLVRFLRKSRGMTTQACARDHFCMRVPDALYGRRGRNFGGVLVRASEDGIVELGGEGEEAWVRLVDKIAC